MKNDKIPITIRIDEDIHQALRMISASEMRSLNTQIEYMLRNSVLEYFGEPSMMPSSKLQALVKRIAKSVVTTSIPEDEDQEQS